jgi:hypothetical protein
MSEGGRVFGDRGTARRAPGRNPGHQAGRRADLIAAVGRTGADSFYRRFTRLAALEPHRRGRMTVALIHGTASSPSSNG